MEFAASTQPALAPPRSPTPPARPARRRTTYRCVPCVHVRLVQVNEFFLNKTVAKILLRAKTIEHFGHQLSCLRPCNARFGLNFLVVCRLYRLLQAMQSCVASKRWEDEYDNDGDAIEVKRLVQKERKWVKAKEVLKLVLPVASMVKLGDFNRPSLTELVPQMLKCEGVWKAAEVEDNGEWPSGRSKADNSWGDYASSDSDMEEDSDSGEQDITTSRSELALAIQEVIQQDAHREEDDDGKVVATQNRWQMMKTDIAFASYVLNPYYHKDKPWENEEAWVRVTCCSVLRDAWVGAAGWLGEQGAHARRRRGGGAVACVCVCVGGWVGWWVGGWVGVCVRARVCVCVWVGVGGGGWCLCVRAGGRCR